MPQPQLEAFQLMHSATDPIPTAARTSITDLLDHGAHLQPGQKVLLLAYLDGLYGGDNMVDRTALQWITAMIEERGNAVETVWIDQPARLHDWKFPEEARLAMERNDLTINHSFDLTVEEILNFRKYVEHDKRKPMVRNFATTAPLLCTSWAQTPQELVGEIRYQASRFITPGSRWSLTDPNGTNLQGVVMPARIPAGKYTGRREEGFYLPWPEWVVPPIALAETTGTFVFDLTLSWWSRYIGVSPYFENQVTLTIENGRILSIDGGHEADAIRQLLTSLHDRLGEAVYNFDTLHFGVHPQAYVAPHQCPSIPYRRMIEHASTCNIHAHLGSPKANDSYPYWPHITGDIRNATFQIGDHVIHDHGHLTTLDHPAVREVAARYPGRPGLERCPYPG